MENSVTVDAPLDERELDEIYGGAPGGDSAVCFRPVLRRELT